MATISPTTNRSGAGAAVQRIEHRQPALKSVHVEAVVAAAQDSYASKTRRSYRSSWRHFVAWCEEQGYEALPAAPEIVAAYLTDRAEQGVSVSSLKVARAAIRYEHEDNDHPSPTHAPSVAKVLRGLRRRAASAKPALGQAKGLSAGDLAAIRATACRPRSGPTGRTELEESARKRGLVDIALCSVMRDGMLRRSEAAALTWSDVTLEEDGSARITIRVSKTDSEGVGAVQFIGPEAVADLKAIRGDAVEPDNRVFGLSDRAISNRIAAAAKAAGLQGRYSGHSPRVGMATDLVASGASIAAVQVAGRWASSRMPALYARGQTAGNGAVAKFYREQGK